MGAVNLILDARGDLTGTGQHAEHERGAGGEVPVQRAGPLAVRCDCCCAIVQHVGLPVGCTGPFYKQNTRFFTFCVFNAICNIAIAMFSLPSKHIKLCFSFPRSQEGRRHMAHRVYRDRGGDIAMERDILAQRE